MITKKSGLLNRARIVLTALVVLTGIGTTMMSMKTVDTYKYRVAETAGQSQWILLKDVTDKNANPYECESSSTVCTVVLDEQQQLGTQIPKSEAISTTLGTFVD